MRLAAIYCVWDDYDLLKISMHELFKIADQVIIIWSEQSNFGEESKAPYLFVWSPGGWEQHRFEPDLNLPPAENERNKRNFGLQKAKESGCTHFLMLDSDEIYRSHEILKELDRFKNNPDLQGLVCGLKCYFRTPTLTVPDITLVPFIHRLNPDLNFTWNRNYPFAWDKENRIRIDPTRQMNINSGVEWSDITMHHYSWIRKDIKKKIRNSTARQNIENSTIVRDYANAKPGYFCEYYKATLEECENLFNIPDIIDENVS